ncbi:YeiH family protein [Alkalihalobacterium alkalinitrilicum]|uniref:YeiH family protein n=1 Tax=Alkalihalobacterium alkalinitrilicum TaxID=427920 RepID=UPI001EE467E8|nr:putative sulfate exporter family transporter [Alkalihalobacterium alkalinitrilicum]
MAIPEVKEKENYPAQKKESRASKLGKFLPGIGLCLSVMVIGLYLAEVLGIAFNYLNGISTEASSPISGVFISIILGLLIRNMIGLHPIFKNGVNFSIKFILKLGIILLGIRLSFMDVVKLGSWGIPIIILCIVSGIFITLWITKKLNQSYRLGTLIACGTGICGVTAILATAPSIKAKEDEVAYAIANITLFGIISMILYPYIAFYLFQNDPIKVGIFLGTAIHDTAQVAGASLIYDQTFDNARVIDVATITKLTRNFLIIAVIPIISFYYLKSIPKDSNSKGAVTPKWYKLIPLFVIGFLILSAIRSIGDAGVSHSGFAFGLLTPENWASFYSNLDTIGTKYMLGSAMAAVGLSTSLSVFKGLGIKPFYIGIIAALSVGVISVIMISLLGGLINF